MLRLHENVVCSFEALKFCLVLIKLASPSPVTSFLWYIYLTTYSPRCFLRQGTLLPFVSLTTDYKVSQPCFSFLSRATFWETSTGQGKREIEHVCIWNPMATDLLLNIDLRHQYEMSVAESQTYLLAKLPKRRGVTRNGCSRRLVLKWFRFFYVVLNLKHASKLKKYFDIIRYITTDYKVSRPLRWKRKSNDEKLVIDQCTCFNIGATLNN